MCTDKRLLSFLNDGVGAGGDAGPACKRLRESKSISRPEGSRIVIFFLGTNAPVFVFKRALPEPAPVAAEGVGGGEVMLGRIPTDHEGREGRG